MSLSYTQGHGRAARTPSVIVPIGRMSEITGLSPRAIRYYEERGLVEPRRDRNSKRGYDRAMRERLTLIAVLRSCGVGLYEVADVLNDLDNGSGSLAGSRLPKLLRARREALEGQLEVLDTLLQTLAVPRAAEDRTC